MPVNTNNCGCQPEVEITHKHCNECTPDIPCECAVKDLSTNCILFTEDDIKCGETTVITKNLNLTDNLKNLVAYICQRFADGVMRLVNIGGGAEIYAGDNLLGHKKLRTIISSDDSILVDQQDEVIDIIASITPQGLQETLDIGASATKGNASYEMDTNGFETITSENSFGFIQTSVLRSPSSLVQLSNYYSENGGANSVQGQFNVDAGKAYIRQNIDGFTSGKTTIVNFQDPTSNAQLSFPAKTINGNYILATEDLIPIFSAGTNISITGSNPYTINNTLVVDGSETKINPGTTTTVIGNGTTTTPYQIETVNLQKSINSSYTLTAGDNNYSIKVDNGSTPVTITVPTGLPENFFVGITQKGTADVTLAGAVGVTLSNPVGLKIQGQGYYVGVEQIGTTNTFDVLANTKA